MPIEMTTLPSGLRIVTDTIESMESVALGVWVGVGTRNENRQENGVAHMVEHMMFKGTKRRSAQDISEAIENVGGHMNAYTGREVTAYYVHLLKDHTDLALEVLADMLQDSVMPEEEVERERGVILQEIKMYEDDPDQLVYDHFLQSAYPDQALGASGLGLTSIIEVMPRATLTRYVEDSYTPEKMVVSAAGPLKHDEFVQKVSHLFDHLPQGKSAVKTPANYNPTHSLSSKTTEQCHMILGFRGVSRHDERYYAQRLLSSILGGGSSSRLYQEVREKRGLVYSIQSFYDSFSDDGLFGVAAGTGPELLPELMPVVLDEIRGIQKQIKPEELARAKVQTKSGVLMAREKMMTRADQQGRYVLNFGKPFQAAEMIQQIDAITESDLIGLAETIFHTAPVMAAIGPMANMMPFDEVKRRLLS